MITKILEKLKNGFKLETEEIKFFFDENHQIHSKIEEVKNTGLKTKTIIRDTEEKLWSIEYIDSLTGNSKDYIFIGQPSKIDIEELFKFLEII